MSVVHPDGKALVYLTWPLIRAIDLNIHLVGETGSLLIKKRKGRVAGFTVTQDSLWEPAVVAAA